MWCRVVAIKTAKVAHAVSEVVSSMDTGSVDIYHSSSPQRAMKNELTSGQIKSIRNSMQQCDVCGMYAYVITKAHRNNHDKFPVTVSYLPGFEKEGK